MPEVVSTKKRIKKAHLSKEEKRVNFWKHLEKLRWHLIRSLIAVVLFALLAFMNRGIIFDLIILAPKEADFPTNILLCELGKRLAIDGLCFNAESLKIINVNMAGQFLTHLYISLIAGIVVAFPYILYQIWSYMAFALKIQNRKTTILTIIFGSLLFVIGLLFSYYLIVPLTINFLGTYHVSSEVQNNVTLGSYISTIASLVLGVGVVFELPVFIFFLSKYGIVSPSFLKKRRKYMLVIILILSAIITPPDIISQIMVSVPLILLYEISIWISSGVYPNPDTH